MLPATSAATVMPQGIASGKFQGGITTATPRAMVLGEIRLAGNVAVPRLGQADHLAGVELAEVDRLGDVAVGLGHGLPHSKTSHAGQLEPPLRKIAAARIKTAARSLSRRARPPRAAPFGLRRLPSRHARPRPWQPAHDARTVARIDRIEQPTSPVSTSSAADQERIATAQLNAHFLECPAHALRRFSGRVKSVGGSLRNGGSSAATAPSTLETWIVASGVNMAPISSGSRSRSSTRRLRGEAGLEERFVRRVFQQPAHQVGHARQAWRRKACRPARGAPANQARWIDVAHAVKHLDLVAARRHAVRLGGGHRVRQAPDVMAAKGRAQSVDGAPSRTGHSARNRRRFATSGGRPARANRVVGRHDLVVPVRPLDQPDRHRRTAALDPLAAASEGRASVSGMIRLHDDADIGPVAELGLRQHLANNGVRQVLVGVLLHVDVDISPQLAGRAQDRPEPRGDAVERRLGVDRRRTGRSGWSA